MAAWLDTTVECPDSATGEMIDNGWGCTKRVAPLSPEAQAIWREVEAALSAELEEKSEPMYGICAANDKKYEASGNVKMPDDFMVPFDPSAWK